MQSSLLNTTNAQHLTYDHPPLQIAVLGGIRLDGLDRLRTTLKLTIEEAGLSLRHSLDLYNHGQVEKLIRTTAEKLEVGTSVTASALDKLTGLLERYRLEELEKQTVETDQRKMPNPEEIKEAKLYLSSPNLMARTGEDIGRAGVIGEEANRLLMYLIFTSRKMDSPLHIISLGSSGAGKTHLQEKVGQLIPEEDKLEITTLSGNAFYYFGQRQLRNKLILIEDLDGAESVLYPLRELQSKKKINKTVVHKNTKGETKSINLRVEGPVSVGGCTTKESLYEDNANRSFLIHINESEAQDEQIMDYQRKLSAGKIDLTEEHKTREAFKNIQRLLQPVQIRNPFAEMLKIPKAVFKPRRTNAHYLAFIEAVTFYHQYQREKQYDSHPDGSGQAGEEFIETTIEDIQEANALMKEVLLRKSDQLNGACRSYFEKLKNWLTKEKKTTFINREVRQTLRIKGTTLRRYHNQLLDTGLIQHKSGKKATGYHYQLTSPDEYQQLRQSISNVLDEVLKQYACLSDRQATAPVASQSKNGSPKTKATKKIKPAGQ